MKITLKEVEEILEEIRKHEDLKKYQEERRKEICEKYGIEQSQFNFLVTVVATERSNRTLISKQ